MSDNGKCPGCGGTQQDVTNSRMRAGMRCRTRRCRDCQHRWLTIEMNVIDHDDPKVLGIPEFVVDFARLSEDDRSAVRRIVKALVARSAP